MSAYNITHCIYCGKKGFKDMDAVIKHVKEKHMVVGGGTQQEPHADVVAVTIFQDQQVTPDTVICITHTV